MGGGLIGFKAICIPLVGEVIVFPILQSPPDERLIFRKCQLHTAWEFLHYNGGSEHLRAWHGQLHWQENTEQEVIVIQEDCERGIHDHSDVRIP